MRSLTEGPGLARLDKRLANKKVPNRPIKKLKEGRMFSHLNKPLLLDENARVAAV
jgi:hypothetical protein